MPERLEEIRELKFIESGASIRNIYNAFKELLEEIDRLRDESEFRHEVAKGYAEKCRIIQAEYEYCRKECEQLRAANEDEKAISSELILKYDQLKHQLEKSERRRVRLREALKWIVPKMHQGNHDDFFDECQKVTCTEYHKALAADDMEERK